MLRTEGLESLQGPRIVYTTHIYPYIYTSCKHTWGVGCGKLRWRSRDLYRQWSHTFEGKLSAGMISILRSSEHEPTEMSNCVLLMIFAWSWLMVHRHATGFTGPPNSPWANTWQNPEKPPRRRICSHTGLTCRSSNKIQTLTSQPKE